MTDPKEKPKTEIKTRQPGRLGSANLLSRVKLRTSLEDTEEVLGLRPADRLASEPEPASRIAAVASQPATPEPLASHVASEPDSQIASPREDEKLYPSRRDRSPLNVRISTQRKERFRLWSVINKVDMQDAVEAGIDWVMSQPASQIARQPGSQQATIRLDDLDDSLNDDVIIFYQKWTGNKATDKDRQAFAEVSTLHPNVIKAGVLVSIFRAKQKINSFRYCIGAIQEIAESGVNPDGDYLRYLMSNAAKGK